MRKSRLKLWLPDPTRERLTYHFTFLGMNFTDANVLFAMKTVSGQFDFSDFESYWVF